MKNILFHQFPAIKVIAIQLECVSTASKRSSHGPSTLWRVAIHIWKTHTLFFRKGHSKKPIKELTFFDDDPSWGKEAKYLTLLLDSKLTFNEHVANSADKFWIKGSPAILSTGSPAILSTGSPAILSTGSPAILSTGSPAILSTGSPAILSFRSQCD
ncbi:hypothetical protein AVEN_4979-1 [Araneus ventricosus]|uniref:Uncharacterized protein n=1 Tax=Araneus ventricosus TaxID=182803 RepID=A0A4Y2SV83_ARAVE|nr:hypothetical protein AVEN_4979-1 [Araneus ventricosus]